MDEQEWVAGLLQPGHQAARAGGAWLAASVECGSLMADVVGGPAGYSAGRKAGSTDGEEWVANLLRSGSGGSDKQRVLEVGGWRRLQIQFTYDRRSLWASRLFSWQKGRKAGSTWMWWSGLQLCCSMGQATAGAGGGWLAASADILLIQLTCGRRSWWASRLISRQQLLLLCIEVCSIVEWMRGFGACLQKVALQPIINLLGTSCATSAPVLKSIHVCLYALQEGALQPVINLLGSSCAESQRGTLQQIHTFVVYMCFLCLQEGALQPVINLLDRSCAANAPVLKVMHLCMYAL
jgi:hypothetical protein